MMSGDETFIKAVKLELLFFFALSFNPFRLPAVPSIFPVSSFADVIFVNKCKNLIKMCGMRDSSKACTCSVFEFGKSAMVRENSLRKRKKKTLL
jgi:hypothetical protein